MVDFSTRLKTLRQLAGLTQQQLGAQIGVTKSVISYYELSDRTPSPEVLVKLAGVFHVSTDYLLGLERGQQTVDVTGLDKEDILAVQYMIDALRRKNKQGTP